MNDSSMISDLLNPEKGYIHLRGFFSREEVDHYREECVRFLTSGPQYEIRVNTSSMRDYVHPRSHDAISRTFRIYQYLHNRHSPETTQFFKKAFALRNELESSWLQDPAYRQERDRLQDYIIVTYYVENTGMLPKHQDYEGDSPHPLLQSLVLLSEPHEDFEGGDFVLYTKSGKTVSLENDVKVEMGDLFLFDKSLFHHVETTKQGHGRNRGRWSVLIGARAVRDSWMEAFKKRLRYGPLLRPVRNLYNRGKSKSQSAGLPPTGSPVTKK
jgi:hypothetical protein